MYNFLTRTRQIPAKNIFAVGHSFGCAPSIYLSAHYTVAGTLITSPFLSVFSVLFPTRKTIFFRDPYNNRALIKKINSPIAIIHGTHDRVIPFKNGQLLASLARAPTKFIKAKGFGHNNLSWGMISNALRWISQHANTQQSQ